MFIEIDDFVLTVSEAIENALGISMDELSCIGPAFALGADFDSSSAVEVEFDGASFMSDYYNGNKISLVVECLDHDNMVMHMFIGSDCSNPMVADEFIDRYMMTTKFPGMWGMPHACAHDCSLMMTSKFTSSDKSELYDKICERLSLFTEERFTNELRPFLHYYEN